MTWMEKTYMSWQSPEKTIRSLVTEKTHKRHPGRSLKPDSVKMPFLQPSLKTKNSPAQSSPMFPMHHQDSLPLPWLKAKEMKNSQRLWKKMMSRTSAYTSTHMPTMISGRAST